MDWITRAAFFLGSTVCHQLPTHSLHPGAHQLPLCARCTGLHFGLWMGIYFLLVLRRPKLGMVPNWKSGLFIGVSFLLMAADVFTTAFGLQPGFNATRVATGLAVGYSLALLMGPVLAEVNTGEAETSRLGWGDIFLGAFLALGLWPLIFYAPSWAFYPITLFEALSVIGTYSLVWGVLIAYIVLTARGRPWPWPLWVGAGAVLAVAQALIVGRLRISLGF